MFWCRRNFVAPAGSVEVARLELHKVMFGARVLLNGKPVGEQSSCFVPETYEVAGVIKPGEGADRSVTVQNLARPPRNLP